MAQVLYFTANPKSTTHSVSLSLGAEFLRAYKEANPEDQIASIDLYNSDIPELDYQLMEAIGSLRMGLSTDNLPEQTKTRLQRYNQLSDQFVNAEKYVFVTPMWNLGLPSRVKDYIDTICVAGKTFKYTEKGPQGLLKNKNKKCLHIHASGGFHSKDPMNHADPFLKDIMHFMGIEDYRSLIAEGHAAIPDKAEAMIKAVYAQIPQVVEWFS